MGICSCDPDELEADDLPFADVSCADAARMSRPPSQNATKLTLRVFVMGM